MEGLGGGLSRLSAPVMDEEWGSEEAGADLLQQWEVGAGLLGSASPAETLAPTQQGCLKAHRVVPSHSAGIMSAWAFPAALLLLGLTSESLQGGEHQRWGCRPVWGCRGSTGPQRGR